ncbi:hypothetical protein [Micromonospora sp. NPDC093277]|uniref:hypothetical protein n=1 Tax=Micromonospora sp. NPDC093277 TaxID=3364291 RepID=UPI003800AB02
MTRVADDVTPARLANMSREFAASLRDTVRAEGRTRAWPLRGGVAEWDRLSAQLAQGWIPAP